MKGRRERLYEWDDKSIQWYKNAVEYRSFHQDVAEMVLSRLPEHPRVCDIGCGIGALTRHLAPKCRSVLAMDLNPKPLEHLKRELEKRGITNVQVTADDFEKAEAPEEKYDAAIFCLAGGVRVFIEAGKKWSDKLFFIENATDKRSFSSVGERSKEVYYNEDIDYLKTSGLKFEYKFFTAPFGQVFRDRDDAIAFMRHYDKGENDSDITAFLNANLIKIDHPEFPLYLPNEKPLVLIEVDV